MRLSVLAGIVLAAAIVVAASRDAAAGPAKGEGPQTIAAAFGSIWVGTGSGAVLRINAKTGDVQAVFRNTGFVHALAAGFGSIWALQDRVVRIDPRSGRAHELPETGSATTFNLEAGAGAIWVADGGRNAVDRIDPRKSRRVATVRVPGRAWGLAAGRGQVLVVSAPARGPLTGPGGPRELRRIDPATDQLSAPLVRLDCDPLITIARRVIWTVDPCKGKLAARSPETLEATSFRDVPRWGTPVIGFGSLWVVGSRSLVRLDLNTLRIVARIRVGGASPVVGGGALWLLDYRGGRGEVIHRIDPHKNRVAATFRVLRS
jgi:hypothetical protein